MACLKVERAGLFTTVQDLGRPGFQRYGVPVGGALDGDSLRVANALVGNVADAAALELRFTGPRLRVDAESVAVALVGASTALVVDGQRRATLPPNRLARLRRGDGIDIAPLRDSATAYLAIAGGVAVAPVLGSRSTSVAGGFGGIGGRKLCDDDEIPLASDAAPETPRRGLRRSPFERKPALRVVLGPQDEMFTSDGIATFLGSTYTVTHEADRMGIRLDGPEIAHKSGYNIVSDGVASGAIQVPGSRQPIILLADRQTTGGYPKVATVISTDIASCGRLRPGDQIRFAAVSIEEAENAARAHERFMRELLARIAAGEEPELDLEALYSQNLISGVVGVHDA